MSIMFTTTQDITILSQGWASTRLVDIAEINPRLPLERIQDDAFVTFVPMKAVEEKTGRFDACNTKQYAEVRKGYTAFMDGDIIFAKITPCMENGKIAIMKGLKNGVGFGSTEFHVIRLTDINLPTEYFVFYLLQEQFRKDAQRNMTGSAGQLRVPAFYLEQASIPLPPLPEQHRIVAKIEELFTKLDAGVDALKKIKAQLKHYRQSVLKYAFEGKLTEGWRKQHSGKTTWSKTLGDYDIPSEWKISRVKEIVKIIDYRGRTPLYSDEGIPHLRSSNIKNGMIIWKDLKYVSNETYIQYMTRGLPKKGDILFTTEAPLGDVALAPDSKFSVAQRLMILRAPEEIINPKYLLYQIMSDRFQNKLRGKGTGTTVTGVSSRNFKTIEIIFPNLDEQYQIVEKIEQSFSIADEVENIVKQSLKQSERLRQSILKKAFEGKLVAQDPNDEPAVKLLERIKAERAQQSNKVSFNKSRSSKQKESI